MLIITKNPRFMVDIEWNGWVLGVAFVVPKNREFGRVMVQVLCVCVTIY